MKRSTRDQHSMPMPIKKGQDLCLSAGSDMSPSAVPPHRHQHAATLAQRRSTGVRR